MRIACHLLAEEPADQLPVLDAAHRALARLWRRRLSWPCRDGLLEISVLALEELSLPPALDGEAVASALARLHRAVAPSGGLLLLRHPAQALGAGRIALAAGVRLFGIDGEGDIAAWDAALSLGMPVFGVRGTVVAAAVRPDACALLSALAYGSFLCEEGLQLRRCDETPRGVDLEAEAEEEMEATVVIRGGFEAACLRGSRLAWRDQGQEGYVRLVVRAAGGTCWTQPRFVAPPPKGDHGHR